MKKKLGLLLAVVFALSIGIMYGAVHLVIALISGILASLGAYRLREKLKKKSRFYRKYILMEEE